MCAANRGWANIVHLLLMRHDVKVNHASNVSTVLHHSKTHLILLYQFQDGSTSLIMESKNGHVSTVEALLTHPEIDINKPNKVVIVIVQIIRLF